VGKAGGVAIVVASLVALSGCGKADDSGQVSVGDAKVKALAAAADKTDAIDTANYRLVGVASSDASQDITVSGSVDRTAHLADAVGTRPHDSGYDGTVAAATEALVDGETVYLKGVGTLFGASTPWVSGDLAVWRSSPWAFIGLTSDPFAMFSPDRDAFDGIMQFLQIVSTGVTEVGTETVDGAATTHYRARLDMNTVEAAMDHHLRETLGTAMGNGVTIDTTPGTLSVDVWIDGNGLIRRFVGTGPNGESSSESSGGTTSTRTSNGTFTITFDLLTTGQPVTITPPPADQVTKVDFSKTDPFQFNVPASTSTTGG
jgi:hypothetical protein